MATGFGRGWARQWLQAALVAALAVLAMPLHAAGSARGGQLTTLKLDTDADCAVLELHLSSRVRERVFFLQSPNRLVIDLPATRRARALSVPAAGGVVSAVRLGPQLDGTLRVVLQLSSAQQIRSLRGDDDGDAGYGLRVELQAPVAQGRAARRPSTISTPSYAPRSPQSVAESVAESVPQSAPQIVKSAPDGVSNRPVIIALDAGHGGQDPGATGANGTHEKDVTLAIARELAERINREPGMKAVLTRNGDYFIPLDQRRKIAHDANADMFVSIHADAIADRAVTGASVYVNSSRGASSATARMLADKENAADLKGGVSISDVSSSLASVILDASGSASRAFSIEAADAVLKSLDNVGVVRKPEVQYAAFVVIKSLDIPSMLVETAYISNPSEERRLRTPEGQDALAGAIFGGIRSYFVTHPPVGTRFAEPVKLARSGR